MCHCYCTHILVIFTNSKSLAKLQYFFYICKFFAKNRTKNLLFMVILYLPQISLALWASPCSTIQMRVVNTINIAKLSRGGRNIPLGTYRISNRCEAGTTGACALAGLNGSKAGLLRWRANPRNLREK